MSPIFYKILHLAGVILLFIGLASSLMPKDTPHRKIGGMYLMAAKLRARIALRPMVETYCGKTATPC